MEKSELLTRLSENPDEIAELSRDELAQAKTELREYGAGLIEGLEESDDKRADIEAANEAKERLAAVKERLAEFEAEDTELAEEAATIGEAFVDDEEPKAEEEEEEEEPEVEGELELEVSQDPEIVTEEEVVAEEPEPVAASKPSIGAIAKRAPKPPEPRSKVKTSPGALVASDYRSFSSLNEIGAAALKAWRSDTPKAVIASIDSRDTYEYTVTGDVDHDSRVVHDMLKDMEQITSPEALTAAVGFCAPAEPRYDYFGIAERAGLIQLPTLNASRGRITYRTSPSYASILANVNWANAVGQTYTSSNVEAGASKNTFEIECPSTTTCSVDAFPAILEFTNFTDRFDPETVANAIEQSMIFHDHYVNAQHIASMVTASTLTATGDTGGGGLVNVANLVGFEAARYRDTYRMSPTATLELVAPAWVHDALVADLVARNATTSFENARARTAAVFASLNVRTQFVQDWQSIGDNADGGWPNGADMLLFAPGTFVRLDGGSLDLGIVRDSTLNATNEFQTFMESFEAVCEIGHDSWLLDGVEVCPRGSAAADVALDCNPGFGS